jgi:hypothetical protein
MPGSASIATAARKRQLEPAFLHCHLWSLTGNRKFFVERRNRESVGVKLRLRSLTGSERSYGLITSATDKRSVLRWYNAISVLHHNDIVEEIATQRRCEIDTIDQYISGGQKMPPHRWRVRFSDGREPSCAS